MIQPPNLEGSSRAFCHPEPECFPVRDLAIGRWTFKLDL